MTPLVSAGSDIVHLKTRWYFMTRDPDGYAIEGAVEFEDDRDGKRCARVYSFEGDQYLWSTTGVRRRDLTNARLAFQGYVWALLEKRKQVKS